MHGLLHLELEVLASLPTATVAAAQNQDRQAQRAVYTAYAARVMGVCLRYGRTRPEAEDFAQDAWVHAFAKLDTYQHSGSLEGWITRVAVTTCLMHLRKRGLKLRELPEVLPKGAQLEPEVLDQLSAADILRHVANLPEGYRVVFNLVAVEGYSHAEAAAALNISESSSRSQLTRARNALKLSLAKAHILCP